MANYQFIFKPRDLHPDKRVDAHFIFSLLHALWNDMSYREREDRQLYIVDALGTLLANTETTYGEVVELSRPILETIDDIYNSVTDLIALFDNYSTNYSCSLDSLIGSSLVINIATVE